MEMMRFVPARGRLTTAAAVGALALTLAGLHAPGAGAASHQPPTCESFTVADAHGASGTATGPVSGGVQVAPIPGAQAGTQAGGAPQGATNQAGQPGTMGNASDVPEVVSCIIDGAVTGEACVVTNQDAAVSTEGGTTAQTEAIAGSVQAGSPQQPAAGQLPAGNQVLDPNNQASTPAGTAAGGTGAAQPNQPFAGTGGDDFVISAANPDGTISACAAGGAGDAGVGVGAGGGVENATATTDAVPTVEQAPTGSCEETVISEYPLPTGGSIKVSLTPC